MRQKSRYPEKAPPVRKMEKRLLDIKELAEYIGKKPQTIRNEISKGVFSIPWIKLRGALRFDIKDIDEYIDGMDRETN